MHEPSAPDIGRSKGINIADSSSVWSTRTYGTQDVRRDQPDGPAYLNNFQNTAPTLRCRPDLVHGMPVARDTRRFAFVTPNWRFQLQPPLFIVVHDSHPRQSR